MKINSDAFKDIEKLEAALWEAADNLRANSKLSRAQAGTISWSHRSALYPESGAT